MFAVNDPGLWQYYVNRQDNKGLPIMEIKNKYMREQFLFEQYMSEQIQQMNHQFKTSGGLIPSSSTGDNTINQYVEDDYIEDYLL